MVSTESLVALGEALGKAGFKVATHQYVAAHHLLLRLAAEGALPESPRDLRTQLGPIFCTSAAEQRVFPEVYESWLHARYATATPRPAPLTPTPRKGRLGWRAALIAMAMAIPLLAGVAWFFVRPQPSTRPPPGPSGPTSPPEKQAGPSRRVPMDALATVPPGSPLLQDVERVATLDVRQVMPESPWARVLWRNVVVSAAPLLLFAAWQVARAARRPVLRRISSRTPDELREVHLPGGARAVLPGFPLRRLAQELRRRRRVASRELQVEPTIRATLENGGLFTPVLGSRLEPSHFVLVDRASLHDHQARLADTVLAELLRSDVLVDGYDFDGDARLCRPWHASVLAPAFGSRTAALARAVGRQALALDELLVRYPDHRVLVFADAAACYDAFEGSPAAWLARLLESHSPILVMPRPQEAWGWREWALQELGVAVVPLSQAGMLGLMAIVADTPRFAAGPTFEPRRRLHEQLPSRWLERNPPADELVQRLCDDLRDDLGPQAFALLGACAAYPEIHWGLTLRLGAALVPDTRTLEALLPRLARLIWLREAFMPDWLREALLDRLEPAEEDLARAALDALLCGLLETSGELPLRIAVSAPPREEPWRGRLRRSIGFRRLRAEGLLREAPAGSPLRDHVFLSFVAGRRRSKLDPLAPARLLQELRNDARRLAWTPVGALLFSLLATTLLASRLPLARLEPYEVGDVALTFLADGSVLAVTASAYDSPDAAEAALWLVRWRQGSSQWTGSRRALGSLGIVNREARPVAVNSNGTRVAWVQPDRRIAVWDVASAQAVGTPRIPGKGGSPTRLQLSPDGRWLAAANERGTSVWNVLDAQPLPPLQRLDGDGSLRDAPGSDLAFNADSSLLAVADADTDQTLVFTTLNPDPATGLRFQATVPGIAPSFSWNGRLMAARHESRINFWDVARATPPSTAPPMVLPDLPVGEIDAAGNVVRTLFTQDDRLLAAVQSDGSISVYEWQRRRPLGRALPGGEVFHVLAFNPGSDRLVVGGRADGSTIWRIPQYPLATIRVVVHVVYATSEQNVSNEQIARQLDVLNADFNARNADLSKVPDAFRDRIGDAAVRFRLADIDPNGQETSGITRTRTKRQSFGADDSVKVDVRGGKDAWPSAQYLNIWVAPLEVGLVGYSQFPGGPPETDGVVIHYKAFGTMGTAEPPNDRGRTTTAQVARYLNVRHIWGDVEGCQGTDYVDDTPNQAGPNHGRPKFPHVSCNNGPSGDMFMNFADYTDDETMVMFTKGQAARMRQTLDGPRSGLLAPLLSRPAPTANTRVPTKPPLAPSRSRVQPQVSSSAPAPQPTVSPVASSALAVPPSPQTTGTSEGFANFDTCRGPAGGAFGLGSANCDEGSGVRAPVCAAVPKDAEVTKVTLRTKWATDATPWPSVSPALPGEDTQWSRFYGERFERAQGPTGREVCQGFVHWSSHQARTARIEVEYRSR